MCEDYSARAVLVVDDEPSVRETLTASILSHFRCTTDAASSGAEAVTRAQQQNYDVIITDMVMPELHGFELIVALRAAAPLAHIMIVTGYPEDFPYVDLVRAGADDFIVKPFYPGEMEAKILRILKERMLRQDLERAEKRYRSLFELSMNGMVLLERNRNAIAAANQAFCALSGRASEDLVGASVFDLFEGGQVARLKEGLAVCARGGQGTLGDLVLTRPDGAPTSVDVNVTFMQAAGESVILLVFMDVTEKRAIEQQLADAAVTDPVTGLANRRTFLVRLEAVLREARREASPTTLLFIDVDDFKKWNDTYGHQTGDKVLSTVGDIIRRAIRSNGDAGYRYGGDEFAVLLIHATAAVGTRIAERLQSMLAADAPYRITISIGVVEHRPDLTADAFLNAADQALYRAKAQGKNAICVE